MNTRNNSGSFQRPTILIEMVTNPAFQKGILKTVQQLDWRIIGVSTLSDPANLEINLAGIISEGQRGVPFVKDLIAQSTPVVYLRPAQKIPAGIYVSRSHSQIADLALRYFRGQGIHSFALLGHKSGHISISMHDTIKQELKEPNETSSIYLYDMKIGDLEQEDELRRFAQWLKNLPKPVGIIGHSDPISSTICRLCLKLGYRIPDDIAVLSIGNNMFYCETSPVTLSSIDCADEQLGEVAVNLLHDIYHGKPYKPGIHEIPPVGVVERRSTVPDSLFAKVMWYIKDNLSSPISVSLIADEFGVSRRTIEREFKHTLNHGVNAELKRLRLARCCQLLKSTNLSFHAVAARSGYSCSNYLQKVFRRDYGMSLQEYRTLFTG